MPTFGNLLDWDGSGLRAAADALLDDVKAYNEVGGDLQGLSVDGFEGQAAEAEAMSRRVLADDAEDIARGLESAGNDLSKASASVNEIASQAQDIKVEATAAGLTVTDDGPQPPVSEESDDSVDINDNNAQPSDYAEQVKLYNSCCKDVSHLIARADDVIVYLRAVFNGLAALGGVAGGPKAEVLAASSEGSRPDPSWTPDEVNDYWTAMSPEQQQHIIENYPQWVGNLDGIPCADRHKANVNRLEHMGHREAELQAAMERTPKMITRRADGGRVEKVTNPEYSRLEQQLKDIKALRRKFDGTGDAPPAGHYLLVLDVPSSPSGGYLRAAVASGNIDDADHVAVHIPGMDSTVEKSLANGSSDTIWGGSVRNMDRSIIEARNQLHDVGRGDEEVAAVTWLGYDAPQGLDAARSDDYAERGAPELARFCEGVQATHHGDPHLTLDGHSYGSLVAGMAAKLLADDSSTVIDTMSVAGSPGTGFTDASDFNLLPEEDMYARAAKGDLIKYTGAHEGRNPHLAQDFTRLATGDAQAPSGQELPGGGGHSEYYDWDVAGVNDDGSYDFKSGGHAQGQAVHTVEGPDGETPYVPGTALHNTGAVIAGTGQEIPHL